MSLLSDERRYDEASIEGEALPKPFKIEDHRVESDCGYPSLGSLMLSEQIDRWVGWFPQLKKASTAGTTLGINTQEVWVAVPDWRRIGDTYSAALDRMLHCLRETDAFTLEIDPSIASHLDAFSIDETSATATGKSAATSREDFLILAVQSGIRYRGYSPFAAEVDIASSHHVALGVFEVAAFLKLYPERLGHAGALGIDCLGTTFLESGSGHLNGSKKVLSFDSPREKVIRLTARSSFVASAYYGTASAIP